jgi:3,4-dihydroxy 2-butanone 4-phosphate synthase/GTP cyclohydrolase II
MTPFKEFLFHFAHAPLSIVIDDTTTAPHAALVAPACAMTEGIMNRVITLSGGLPFVAISPERAAAFLLPSMSRPLTSQGASEHGRASSPQFVSVEAREGITTGISAADRALTVSILGAENPQPRKLVKPGHIFPVETREGGVLVKMAIPEAALDIVTLAGFTDAAFYLDLLGTDGELLPLENTKLLAAEQSLPITTLTQLVEYRLEQEPLIARIAEAKLPTAEAGEVKAIVYHSKIHDIEHVALVKGDVTTAEPILVRVQAENTVADVFGGDMPPSRKNLHLALKMIGERGKGIFLYLRRTSLGLTPLAPASGASPTAAMMREYGVGAQILRDLGVSHIELIAGTSRSMAGLGSFGINIVSQRNFPTDLPDSDLL